MILPAIAHGLIDANGCLIEAEDALLDLNTRAGGQLGSAPAVPQLATLARLARRLQVPIARSFTVADRDADIELLVRASTDGPNVRITVADWRERQPWRPASERTQLDLLRTEMEWSWETDAALRIGFLSTEAGLRHGFDALGLLGKSLTDLFAFQTDDEGELPILEALAGRRAFFDQPARLKGSGLFVLVSALARRNTQGDFAGFAGGAVLASSTVASGPQRNQAALSDRLERALRPPLGQIIANATSIGAGGEGPIGPDYAAYAGDIATAGRHLMALVDDLADLETVEQDDFRPALERIDLVDLARRAAGLLAVPAANGKIKIARPEPSRIVPVIGDFRRVLQILVNLIGNAVRYAPRGSTVDVTVEQDGRVIVSDQGKGIADEDQERVFGKFERVDSSEPDGSGLGLYIARRLTRAMDGDLTLESAPGQGASFTLRLRPEPTRDKNQR